VNVGCPLQSSFDIQTKHSVGSSPANHPQQVMNLLIAACMVAMAAGGALRPAVYYGLPSGYHFASPYPTYAGPSYSLTKYAVGAVAPKQAPLILKPVGLKLERQDAETTRPQEIKLLISIPVVPENSSVSINVKIDSLPSGPVVSVSNPTAVPGSPATIDDTIIVDVGVDGAPEEEIDEEFAIREPPPGTGENPFENSKDSAFLASMLSG